MRVHRKVWVWWGKWWAVQFMRLWDEYSLGIRLNVSQPVLDLYIGPITIAIGKHPEITHPVFGRCFSCRGFFVTDRPIL